MIYLGIILVFGCIYYKDVVIKSIYNMGKENTIITKKGKGVYELECTIENKICRILIKVRKGPQEDIIVDDNNNDITYFINEFNNYKYLGFVPKYYNYNYIKIIKDSKEEIINSNESLN